MSEIKEKEDNILYLQTLSLTIRTIQVIGISFILIFLWNKGIRQASNNLPILNFGTSFSFVVILKILLFLLKQALLDVLVEYKYRLPAIKTNEIKTNEDLKEDV